MNWQWVQKTSRQGCGIFGFLVDFICGNEYANKIMQFWPPNVSIQGMGKLSGLKVGTSHRGMKFFYE